MKRLNPLYIILLFVTFAFLSFYTSSNKKEAYIEKLNEVKNLQIKALEFRNLVNTWRNENI